MQIAIIGAKGMLGSDLYELLYTLPLPLPSREGKKIIESKIFSPPLVGGAWGGVVPLDLDEINITNRNSVFKVLGAIKPAIIINCAAYTNVDGAEDNRDAAFAVNATGPKNLAEFATETDSIILHISTDYVFDGKNKTPYKEDDPTSPLGVYGASKLAGEIEVRKHPKHYILRTSWLYGKNGKNFIKTIIKAAGERDELKVVNDQKGSPTYTIDLAGRIIEIVDKWIPASAGMTTSAGMTRGPVPFGTYHTTGTGETTWYSFAKKALNIKGIETPVKPVSSSEYPSKVTRPAYSVLSNEKAELAGMTPMPKWSDALERYFLRNASLRGTK